MPALLSLRDVTRHFGEFTAVDRISLEIRQGEFIALLGPSGCGKTTLLRLIAGFLAPDAGSISIDGAEVTREPPHRRPLNTVFQNYALFPHLSVLDNVAYGPRRHGLANQQARERALGALDLVGLDGFGDRYPRQLSGGQQQRVALARAIVNQPKLLLLDEPLSALDLKLRKRMRFELKHLQERLGIAFVFVTHDQEEAMAMADRIVVMNAGRIEQVGVGDEIYARPASRFVADFIGDVNLIECEVDASRQAKLDLAGLVLTGVPCAPGRHAAVIRPEHVKPLAPTEPAPAGQPLVEGVIEDIAGMGSHMVLQVRVGATALLSRRIGAREPWLHTGAPVRLLLDPQRFHYVVA